MNLNCKQGAALLLALGACAPAPLVESAASPQRVERRLAAMGTHLNVVITADSRAAALAQSEVAVRAIEAVEARLSTWRTDSELARVNSAEAGFALPLSPELASDLERAGALWKRTDGIFDPALGTLVRAWDLRGAGRRPTDEAREQALLESGWKHFALEGGMLQKDIAGVQLEEGGFGKGIALDAALAAVPKERMHLIAIDLGGQWIVRTNPAVPRQAAFSIGIADPSDRTRSLMQLDVQHGSVATSGNSERAVVADGERYGHILDPRSGQPAPDFGSITVLASDATTADALATALFVLGPDAALRFAAAAPDLEAVVVEPTAGLPRVRATAGLRKRLTPLIPDLTIEIQPSATTRAQHE